MTEMGGGQVHALMRVLHEHEREVAVIPHIVVCRAGDRRGEVYFGPFPDRAAAVQAASRLSCSDRHHPRLHQPVPLLGPEGPG